MNPSRGPDSEANPRAVSTDMNPPQDSSLAGAELDVSPSSWNSSQGSSGSGTAAPVFGSTTEDPTGEWKIPWDPRASYIVFGLRFLGCQVQSIYSVLRSYGFRCSIRDIKRCVHYYRLGRHDKVAHPLNGYTIRKMILKSGIGCTWTVRYVHGRPKMMIVKHAVLRAQTPDFGQLLSSADGDQITVEITQGRLQMRVLDRPAPKRRDFTTACRAAYQSHPETLE